MANFYTVDKEINGTTYTAQFCGLSAALKAIDDSYIDGTSNISINKLAGYIFEHIIVEPSNLDADSFDDIDTFNEVVAFGREVMQGKFREKKDARAAKGKSKE